MSKSNLNNAAHAMLAELESNPGAMLVVFSAGEIKAARQLVANGLATMTPNGSEYLVALKRQPEAVKVAPVEVAPVQPVEEAEEVLATAEAALVYREPVAAFIAPTALASGKSGEMFDWTHPNFRPNAECRFEAADGEVHKGRIVRVTVYGGERVGWVTYRNDARIRLTERVPVYRVWPYGGIQRGEQKTTWGAREREIRNRAFEKGSDD